MRHIAPNVTLGIVSDPGQAYSDELTDPVSRELQEAICLTTIGHLIALRASR